jgi:hypothetical protein
VLAELRAKKQNPSSFSVDFLPMNATEPAALAQMVNSNDGDPRYDQFDSTLVGQYTCNESSKLGDLDIFIDRNRHLPLLNTEATELYPSRVLDSYFVVVRIGGLASSSLQMVVDYYETAYKHPQQLTIYFTTSGEKWMAYPRVYPASVPAQIAKVFHGSKSSRGFVDGSKFH